MIKNSSFMVTVNYQMFGSNGFRLRLRLYQDGETKYINVTKLLKGSIQRKHWNQKKQQFIPSCPYSAENNDILVRFRQKYDEKAIDWNGSLFGFIASFQEEKEPMSRLDELFDFIINEKKGRYHSDGTQKGTFECYEKARKKVIEYCGCVGIVYENLLVSEVSPVFVNGMFDWIRSKKNGKGLANTSRIFHAVMGVAEREGIFDMATLKSVRWKKKDLGSVHKYRTLSESQCKKLEGMGIKELPRSPRSLLYRDFCMFLIYTGQSPCDAIALKYSDIENIDGIDHFVFNRRKISDKQPVPCAVPINPSMRIIMERWKNRAKDGYVFPIRSKEKLTSQKTNNGDIKHFIGNLNHWLKRLAVLLGCDFSLHTYTFRHTAITRYISRGVPVTYVANIMGTSVKNCEQIYYNNKGDVKSRDLVLSMVV